MVVGRPRTLAEADEMIDRVTVARREAVKCRNRALVVEADDLLIEIRALRNALIPEQRKP